MALRKVSCSATLKKIIEEILANSSYLQRIPIDVDVCSERVVLRGTVNSFHQKQWVTEAVRPEAKKNGLEICNKTKVL